MFYAQSTSAVTSGRIKKEEEEEEEEEGGGGGGRGGEEEELTPGTREPVAGPWWHSRQKETWEWADRSSLRLSNVCLHTHTQLFG